MKDSPDLFYTHEKYLRHRDKYENLIGPNGSLLFVSCDAGLDLARKVKQEYEETVAKAEGQNKVTAIPLLERVTRRFERDGKDGTCPNLPHNVAGANAFVFQNCMEYGEYSRSVNENLMQLCQMIATLKDQKASRVTAILPYFPYSRQDKPTLMEREYPLAKSVADLLVTSGVDSVLSYHPHSISLKGLFPIGKPFNYISGIDLMIDVFSEFRNDPETAVFSTDAGGFKEARFIGKKLGLRYGACSKNRASDKKETETIGAAGDLNGIKKILLPDDEGASFKSGISAMESLSENGPKEFHIFLSHSRIAPGEPMDRLKEAHEKYGMVKYHTTDSIPQTKEFYDLEFLVVHSLSRILTFAINRMHYDMSVSKLFPNLSK